MGLAIIVPTTAVEPPSGMGLTPETLVVDRP